MSTTVTTEPNPNVLLQPTYNPPDGAPDDVSDRWANVLLDCMNRLDLAAAVCTQSLDGLDDETRAYAVETVIRDTRRVLAALREDVEGATVVPRGQLRRGDGRTGLSASS